MNEVIKNLCKKIDQLISLASNQLSPTEYLELLDEVENMVMANYNAMVDQLNNEKE